MEASRFKISYIWQMLGKKLSFESKFVLCSIIYFWKCDFPTIPHVRLLLVGWLVGWSGRSVIISKKGGSYTSMLLSKHLLDLILLIIIITYHHYYISYQRIFWCWTCRIVLIFDEVSRLFVINRANFFIIIQFFT